MTQKNTIRLTESELKKIISESVKRVLRESIYNANDGFTSSMSNTVGGNSTSQQIPKFKHVDKLDPASRKRIIDIINRVLYDEDGYFHANNSDIMALGKELNMSEDEMERNGIMDIISDTVEVELEAGRLY